MTKKHFIQLADTVCPECGRPVEMQPITEYQPIAVCPACNWYDNSDPGDELDRIEYQYNER